MGMIMHDDVPYGEGTSYTPGTGIVINNNVIAVDADNTPTENSEKPVKSKGVSSTVKQIYADNGVLGAKNLLPYPYADKASTQNGVTYTYDEDGVVTANGTATATSWRTLEQNEFPNLKVGADYILSGCPQGGASDTYFLQLSYDNGTKFYKDTGNGVRFTNTGNLTRIQIIINSGITANNITFKPMLRLASDPDDTYVPYAMTNRELTEDTHEIKYRVGILSAKVPYYVANATMPRKKTLSSAELTEARARAAEQDYKTVVPGDIIIGPNTGTEYYLAKCWGRKGVGDSQPTGGAALTPNLMLMLYKPHGITRLWAGYGNADKSWRVSANDLGRCPWNAAVDVDPTDSEAIGVNNTNITRAYDNNGTSVNVSGYMGSFIRKMLDERLLVDCFEADFGAANILPYRSILGNAIKTDSPSGGHPAWNGLTNGWAWYTRKLDLPGEIELYGSIVWSSSGFDVGIQNEQLPFLKLGDIDLFFPRFDIWTKAVGSGSSAARRSYDGPATGSTASGAYWACPLACIK